MDGLVCYFLLYNDGYVSAKAPTTAVLKGKVDVHPPLFPDNKNSILVSVSLCGCESEYVEDCAKGTYFEAFSHV